MSAFKDITGQTFGQLKVINRADNDIYGSAQWNCRCSCGKAKVVSGIVLRAHIAKSCGCLMKQPKPPRKPIKCPLCGCEAPYKGMRHVSFPDNVWSNRAVYECSACGTASTKAGVLK